MDWDCIDLWGMIWAWDVMDVLIGISDEGMGEYESIVEWSVKGVRWGCMDAIIKLSHSLQYVLEYDFSLLSLLSDSFGLLLYPIHSQHPSYSLPDQTSYHPQ